MEMRPSLAGAACSESNVIRQVSRWCVLGIGRRSCSIVVAGEEGNEVHTCRYVRQEAKVMQCGERGGKDGRVGTG
jgi:hypothetical protein